MTSLSSSGCWGLDASGMDALDAASAPASFFLPNPILLNILPTEAPRGCGLALRWFQKFAQVAKRNALIRRASLKHLRKFTPYNSLRDEAAACDTV